MNARTLPLLAFFAVSTACMWTARSAGQSTYDGADVNSRHAIARGKSPSVCQLTLADLPLEIVAVPAAAGATLKVTTQELKDRSWKIIARYGSDKPVGPVQFHLSTKVRLNGITGLQHYSGNLTRDLQARGWIPYWAYKFTTGPTLGDPFFSYIGPGNENRFALGVCDPLGKYEFTQEISDPMRSMFVKVVGPLDEKTTSKTHEAVFFLSLANRDTFDVFSEFSELARQASLLPPLPVPEWAYDPIYCTWSAVRTYVDAAWVHRIVPLATSLGFKTLILDDGWFDFDETAAGWDKAARPEAYVGNWNNHPVKFPQLAQDVQAIQAQGMRVLLWSAPFRIGARNALFSRFERLGWHRSLNDPKAASVYIDPRYPAVRDFVHNTVHKLMEEYGVDGLKVDMIDSVGMRIEPYMDPSIEGEKAGVPYQQLMGGVMKELRRRWPQLVVEARIGYANLAAKSWANAYRVADCPYNIDLNRASAAVLRRLYPDRAIYMDPVIWPEDESDANVGRIMISSILAVPQLSVALDAIPESQRKIIRHWIGFYQKHRDTIMHGKFQPCFFGDQLPEARFDSESETIIGLYGNRPVVLGASGKPVFLLNGSARDSVDIAHTGKPISVAVVDRYGQRASPLVVTAPIAKISVPLGGCAEIYPADHH